MNSVEIKVVTEDQNYDDSFFFNFNYREMEWKIKHTKQKSKNSASKSVPASQFVFSCMKTADHHLHFPLKESLKDQSKTTFYNSMSVNLNLHQNTDHTTEFPKLSIQDIDLGLRTTDQLVGMLNSITNPNSSTTQLSKQLKDFDIILTDLVFEILLNRLKNYKVIAKVIQYEDTGYGDFYKRNGLPLISYQGA